VLEFKSVDAPPAQVVSPLLSLIAQQGVLGAVLIVVGWFAWQKDRESKAESLARIQDAKDFTNRALDLQAKLLDNIDKLNTIFEETRKMMAPPNNRTGVGR